MGNRMRLQIASRVISIVLASFALGALVIAIDAQEAKTLESFSTIQDLLAYENSFRLDSYWLCVLVCVLAGFAYVGLVEGVALLVRIGTERAFSRD